MTLESIRRPSIMTWHNVRKLCHYPKFVFRDNTIVFARRFFIESWRNWLCMTSAFTSSGGFAQQSIILELSGQPSWTSDILHSEQFTFDK